MALIYTFRIEICLYHFEWVDSLDLKHQQN